MTIAAGFRVSDGVLLCADTQLTIPGLGGGPTWNRDGEKAPATVSGRYI
jgi:hypothetical protein